MPVGDAEEKMKNQPEQLAKLKSLAPQVKHHFTGEEMIWVPTLSMKDEQKTNCTQERKRTLSSEQKVKATTPAKVAKVDLAGRPKTAEDGSPIMAPVPESLIKKLSKVAEDMETSLVQVACHFWAQSDLDPMGRMKV